MFCFMQVNYHQNLKAIRKAFSYGSSSFPFSKNVQSNRYFERVDGAQKAPKKSKMLQKSEQKKNHECSKSQRTPLPPTQTQCPFVRLKSNSCSSCYCLVCVGESAGSSRPLEPGYMSEFGQGLSFRHRQRRWES